MQPLKHARNVPPRVDRGWTRFPLCLPCRVKLSMHLCAHVGTIPDAKFSSETALSQRGSQHDQCGLCLKKKCALWCVVAVDSCSMAIRVKVVS